MAIPAGVQSTGQINAPSRELISRDPADYPACKFYIRCNELSGTTISDFTGNTVDGDLIINNGTAASLFNTQNSLNFVGDHGVDDYYFEWDAGEYDHVMPDTDSMMFFYDVDLTRNTGNLDTILHVSRHVLGAGALQLYLNGVAPYRINFLVKDDKGNQKIFTFGSTYTHDGVRSKIHIVWNRVANDVWIELWGNGVLQWGRFTGLDAGSNIGVISETLTQKMRVGGLAGSGSPVDYWIKGTVNELSVWRFTNGIPSNYLDAIAQQNALSGGYGFPVAFKGLT